MAAFRRCTRAGHRSTLIRGLYTKRGREGGGEENEASSSATGSGLQSGGGESERKGGAQGRAGNYVSGRPFVRLQSSLHNTGLGRSWLAPSQGKETRRRGSKEETRERARRGEERGGERDVRDERKKWEVTGENPDPP